MSVETRLSKRSHDEQLEFAIAELRKVTAELSILVDLFMKRLQGPTEAELQQRFPHAPAGYIAANWREEEEEEE